VSRSARLVVSVLLVLVVALPACSAVSAGDEPVGAAGQDEETAERATSDVDAFPVTLAHRHGETTITERPERVVAVGFNDADVVLSLGVVPLGERALLGGLDASDRPWFADELGDRPAPELLGAEELDFEVIARLQPDLILGMYSAMTAEEYETLSAIAPTVAQPDDFIDWGVPWREQLERTGRALGEQEGAAALREELEAAFAAARASLPELEGATFAFASAMTPELYVYTADDLRARFFADLGLEVSDEVTALTDGDFYAQISREQAPVLEADVLVVYADRDTFVTDPVFAQLEAVEQERVLFLDPSDHLTNAVGFSSPLSLPYALDGFLPRLRDALDGDPATVPAPTS
jgi:iron complex transport system substrate-binding protein